MTSDSPKSSAFERFEELARRVIHVPKKEVDKKEAERKRRQQSAKTKDQYRSKS